MDAVFIPVRSAYLMSFGLSLLAVEIPSHEAPASFLFLFVSMRVKVCYDKMQFWSSRSHHFCLVRLFLNAWLFSKWKCHLYLLTTLCTCTKFCWSYQWLHKRTLCCSLFVWELSFTSRLKPILNPSSPAFLSTGDLLKTVLKSSF